MYSESTVPGARLHDRSREGSAERLPGAGPGLESGGADTAGTNTDLDDVGAVQYQFFGHFPGDDITGDNDDFRVGIA